MAEETRNIAGEQASERQRFDRLYQKERPANLRLHASAWERFDGDEPSLNAYVASIRWLGSIRGQPVLDAGCGDGWLSVILAKRGAVTYAFDVSTEALRVARDRARDNEVADRCRFVVASFYAMPFKDETFQAATGANILFRLNHKNECALELARVMKPGGHATFNEPFGNVLWFERLRLMLPVPPNAEDPDEWRHKLKYADLEPFGRFFGVRLEEFQLLSRLDRMMPSRRLVGLLNRLDRWLLAHVPVLRPLAREAAVEFHRKDAQVIAS